MTELPLTDALANLSDIQRDAVAWNEGALLVLAGPGSGKTQVLTCRIARLLDEGRKKNFRVLALTFTNKAADEMIGRVREFVPGLEERASIGTFHSFCGQILRQHGVHLGIQPDFAIYALEEDRKSILEDAIRRSVAAGQGGSLEDIRYLSLIDKMKAALIDPDRAPEALRRFPDLAEIARTYQLYEEELRRVNALDFNSLILEAYRLAISYPPIAARYRRSHPYWLLDEFQDTNDAQYRFLRSLAGDDFKSVFAVADDDQIIYEWNGASFRQMQRFSADFNAGLVQLTTNHRCPPAIVEAANRLVAYNAQRTEAKRPLIAGKTKFRFETEEQLQLRGFENEDAEAEGIADEILASGKDSWGQTAILARTRGMLDRVHRALHVKQVPSVIAQRRDDFLSAELRWMVSILRQVVRPLDRRNLTVLVEAFNRITNAELTAVQVMTDAEVTAHSYIETWCNTVKSNLGQSDARLIDIIEPVLRDRSAYRQVIDVLLTECSQKKSSTLESEIDFAEDSIALREISRDIARHVGSNIPLEQFLQELQLRSKEPTPNPGVVTLMTIHGAKGREFDFVYVIGLAEDIMPSFQSRKKGDKSPEMEEERRNCFVAITRTKERLVLSRAENYRGWRKTPSRFLVEMGLAR